MTLRTLLQLQFLYAGLGLLFNWASFWAALDGGQPLTSTPPAQGALAMTLYGLCLLPGYFGAHLTYRWLMGAAILVLGYGGVVKHVLLLQSSPELYSSVAAGAAGIAINVFGLYLNARAALGMFRS